MTHFILLCIYAMAFRWFIFRYKKTGWFREWLKSFDQPLINELLECCYCQTIEAATVVSLSLQGLQAFSLETAFSILAVGWISILLEDWAIGAIERLELRTRPQITPPCRAAGFVWERHMPEQCQGQTVAELLLSP